MDCCLLPPIAAESDEECVESENESETQINMVHSW